MKFTLLDDNDEPIINTPEEVVEEVVENIEEEEVIESDEEVVEEAVEEEIIEESDEDEYIEIDSDDDLVAYINENPEVLDKLSLKEQRELPEDVKRYLEFREETNGRSYSDFIEYQNDFSEMGSEEKVKRFIKENNPEFSNEDINDEYNDRFKFDEDLDDDGDINRKKRELKKITSKADNYFAEQKEKWGAPLGSNEETIPDEYVQAKRELDESRQEQAEITELNNDRSSYFVNQTENLFDDEFKGFEFKIGDEVISHDVSNVGEVAKAQTDLSSFFSQFVDEDGYIKDTEGYHKALYVAMNYESVLKNVYDSAVAKQVENDSKASKNIDMGRARKSSETIKSGMKFKIIN